MVNALISFSECLWGSDGCPRRPVGQPMLQMLSVHRGDMVDRIMVVLPLTTPEKAVPIPCLSHILTLLQISQ